MVGFPPEACEEAMELYSEQMKLQAERKPLPKQESKAYIKIRVSWEDVSGDNISLNVKVFNYHCT